ncbi:MAG: enoyl-CoA hydratase/isomerase family protein [Acidimicrobiia bacterium]
MTDFRWIRVSADGPVGRLELDRPERLNALSAEMLAELIAAARWFDRQTQVKVVAVTAAGPSFTGGFDLSELTDPDPEMPMREVADLGRAMSEAISSMRAVTVVGVQGHCVGGGIVLVASCDLRLAADTVRFSIPEVDLGIPLAWSGIPRLVREIGPALTKELVLTCRTFDAAEAVAIHFVNRVVPEEELRFRVETLVSELAAKSTLTLTATKAHVNAVSEEMASTASGRRDGDVLASALGDPESSTVRSAYLRAHRSRRSR